MRKKEERREERREALEKLDNAIKQTLGAQK